MEYEILAIFWLLFMFFGCCGLYCFTMPPRVKAIAESQEAKAITPAFQTCDFRNTEYAFAWCNAFHRNCGLDVNSYLGLMVKKYDFAMPGKECIAWWKDMIKRCKPASPAKPVYYDHITIKKAVIEPVKYPSYGGNGFGRLPVNEHIPPMANSQWFKNHYAKYPDGGLPEQTMIKERIK